MIKNFIEKFRLKKRGIIEDNQLGSSNQRSNIEIENASEISLKRKETWNCIKAGYDIEFTDFGEVIFSKLSEYDKHPDSHIKEYNEITKHWDNIANICFEIFVGLSKINDDDSLYAPAIGCRVDDTPQNIAKYSESIAKAELKRLMNLIKKLSESKTERNPLSADVWEKIKKGQEVEFTKSGEVILSIDTGSDTKTRK